MLYSSQIFETVIFFSIVRKIRSEIVSFSPSKKKKKKKKKKTGRKYFLKQLLGGSFENLIILNGDSF